MNRLFARSAWLLPCILLWTAGCASQPDTATTSPGSFPPGTVRIVVGYAAGGGYDLGARLVARHLGRHLPGTPAVVVENMPGAGGVIATKYLANSAARDGLTIGLLAANSFAPFGSGEDAASASDFAVVASPAPVQPVCAFTRTSGVTSASAWRGASQAPRLGTAGPGSISHVITRILQEALELPVRTVAGYSGSAEARMALNNGEIDGFCATWETLEGPIRDDAGLLPVLRLSEDAIPGFDDLPDAMALATSERGRRLLAVGIYATNTLGRVYTAPAGVPAPVLEALRVGFARTFADPAFIADATSARVTLAPVPVSRIQAALDEITAAGDVLADLRAVLEAR